jgi:octaprenyl-diphosphate synthase
MMHAITMNGVAESPPKTLPESLVSGDLEAVERILTSTLSPHRAHFGKLIEHLRHYRGKRLRPLLLLLVGKACGTVKPAHHTLGAAVEMIHTATLVHDDVLDEADTRRHVRTINADHGNKMSILLGDLLFTRAFHLTSTIGDPRACEWIGEATNRVCAGELRQVVERGNLDLREEDYFSIIDGKTAALTECCCKLGAVYAGAEDDIIEKMAAYGRHLGIAFQIADDLLDLVGSEGKTGKTLGTDLEQGKLTLPLIMLFDQLPTSEANRLRKSWREGDRSFRNELLSMLQDSGILESARCRAQAEAECAVAQLDSLERTVYRECLVNIARWSIRREL